MKTLLKKILERRRVRLSDEDMDKINSFNFNLNNYINENNLLKGDYYLDLGGPILGQEEELILKMLVSHIICTIIKCDNLIIKKKDIYIKIEETKNDFITSMNKILYDKNSIDNITMKMDLMNTIEVSYTDKYEFLLKLEFRLREYKIKKDIILRI